MSSLQSLRELISERLAAAAEEIFRLCEGTIVQYEQELCRQRRLLDICWKPQLQLHHIVLPQHLVIEDEDLCNQQRNFRVEQNDPEPTQTKEELEEPELLQVKKEQEEEEPPQIEEELEEPEPPQIKKDQEQVYISQDEEHLDLKQETDTLMDIPTYEQSENSEADLNNQQSFNGTDSQDEELRQDEKSTSTTEEETDLQNRDQRKRDRGHVLSVDNSHISESQCCSDVGKQFKKGTLGRKDKQSVQHSVEQPHVCEECGKIFGYKSLFRIHMRTHTGEKPHSCKECDKSFNCKSYLKRHMTTHTKEKPFSCKECNKRFGRLFSLKTHMKTHTGEKPFSCKECDKEFGQLCNLKTHMRTHTGEKLFLCKECDKSYS
ncbi:hypothetical protein OJAV_G00219270 [Oryzias javanicus]|uniref:C2H2-type domain-containing protein n=1 Tax=Oryzias javanicus TaxID=123683 RepID=A0A437C0I6_ORYJA|nr:hypothetical protein OJAV_G00219270 [Oryzias javanicus]